MKKVLNHYYEKKEKDFGISGDRFGKTRPFLMNIKNRVVLDVGCASGYLGAFVKKKGNYVVGIDNTKKDVLISKKVLDEAYLFDLEEENRESFIGKFDFIIFTEVIEHLFSSSEVLIKLVSWLKPDGKILISTPNFTHIYNRWNILLGKFRYQEDTIINTSHVHFFTYDTLKELIISSGLDVIDENNLIFPRTLGKFWKFFPRLFAYQMIFLCQKRNDK